MRALEPILASLSIFEPLRADEIGRIAQRFEPRVLAPGESLAIGASASEARLVVVIAGRVAVEVASPAGPLASEMEAGDRIGDVTLLTGEARATKISASSEESATIATLDRASLDAILGEFPAVALPLSGELARELAARNDLVRQLLELHAAELPREELASALDERRRTVNRRGARVARLSPRALFRRFVVQEGAEPPFWMLAGFVVSLGLARLTVALILKYHLEKQLFALVPGSGPNPMHVHHFNYGLVLIGAAGLAALFPFGRRALRVLSFAFGAGCGLVFDEFALFWNLNPEYAQSLSLLACAAAAGVLAQIVWFRRYWAALSRRAWFSLRGGR